MFNMITCGILHPNGVPCKQISCWYCSQYRDYCEISKDTIYGLSLNKIKAFNRCVYLITEAAFEVINYFYYIVPHSNKDG